MSGADRLQRVRRELVFAAFLSAGVWGAASALVLLVMVGIADAIGGLALSTRAIVPPMALLVGVMVGAFRLIRAAPMRPLHDVALWVEAQSPALRYALVTRIDPTASASATVTAALDAAIARVPFEADTRRAAWRPIALPAVAAVLSLVVLLFLPSGAAGRVARPAPGDLLRRGTKNTDALAAIVARIAPPAYTKLATTVLENPAQIAAPIGSIITVEGRVGDAPVSAALEATAVAPRVRDDRWEVTLAAPARPGVLHLRQGARERLVLVASLPDSAPSVTLDTPRRDSVYRTPNGVVALSATLRDDYGLADGWFEVVISSGEGENFTFKTLLLGRTALGNTRGVTRTAQLVLDSLDLAPGALLHIRAVARDGNTVTGPGIGSSETRSIRIARPSDGDSVTVDAAIPPDSLKGLISERMLILMTEKLLQQRRRLDRTTFVEESRRIASDQNRLRRQVGDIIFQRLDDAGGGGEHAHADGDNHAELTPEQLLKEASEATNRGGEPTDFAGDESPVVNINRPLLEAYNAMWDASRELGVGDPAKALPHMYVALAAIQKARAAERIYLRGKPPVSVVDVARVRLAGKRDGIGPGTRTPRADVDGVTRQRLARFDQALALLGGNVAAATDSLLVLRADLLANAPTSATALGVSIDRLRAGTNATDALRDARRALAGGTARPVPLGEWSVVP